MCPTPTTPQTLLPIQLLILALRRILPVPKQEVKDIPEALGGLAASRRECDYSNGVPGTENFIEDVPNTVEVFLPDLDERTSGVGQQLPCDD
jgi:hypothetical protein